MYFTPEKKEHFSGLYMRRPSKCFSCEKEIAQTKGPHWAWKGQVSKCFDCEKDLVNRLGPRYGAFGGNTKTF